MYSLKKESIKTRIADTPVIFKRGEQIYLTGNYNLAEGDFDLQKFEYLVDGNYGDYIVNVGFSNGNIHHTCDCPYPGEGCKHTVAVCLDILDRVERFKLVQQAEETVSVAPSDDDLSYEEIKTAALATRKKSAKSEAFQILLGETFKGEHLITTSKGKQYTVILHNPLTGEGHCSCPDFSTNKLGTCKHILYFHEQVQQEKGFHLRVQKEKFPFVHLYWDSSTGNPRFFYDRQLPKRIRDVFSEHFDKNGFFQSGGIKELFTHLEPLHGIKSLKVDEYLWEKANENELLFELETIKKNNRPSYDVVNARLYPYQKEGVDFSVFKKSAIIADEMGLGKTLQAITTALLKKELFGFEKVLIVCPASLKEQWRREIVRFSNENPVVIGGTKSQRQEMYKNNRAFFKITNYEAVLRDVFAISRFKPHLIILDEAQRIKNYETKTAEAIKSIPHKHSLVITGTPLDNR
ncbi:MAG: SNF2-related protein, partial [Nitrospinota bacterium]